MKAKTKPKTQNEMPAPTPKYEETGRCFFCFGHIEALQPGGSQARHVGNHIPLGECEKALRAIERGAVLP